MLCRVRPGLPLQLWTRQCHPYSNKTVRSVDCKPQKKQDTGMADVLFKNKPLRSGTLVELGQKFLVQLVLLQRGDQRLHGFNRV